jgi:hypothetical protein
MTSQTPDQIATNWSQNLASSTSKITNGVNAVTVAPGQAAARQKDVWLQNTQAAQAKWAQRVAAVPLSDWQAAMNTKGVPRIASGATAAQPKFASFMTKFLPHLAAGKAALPARGTLDQNINRSAAMIRHNATFKNS